MYFPGKGVLAGFRNAVRSALAVLVAVAMLGIGGIGTAQAAEPVAPSAESDAASAQTQTQEPQAAKNDADEEAADQKDVNQTTDEETSDQKEAKQPVDFNAHTVKDTVSPSGTTINLFDYWMTAQGDPDNGTANKWLDTGINKNHRFKFVAGSDSTDKMNEWTGEGGGPRTGIVNDTLSDGMPQLTEKKWR